MDTLFLYKGRPFIKSRFKAGIISKLMILFFIGILEMLIVTTWTKFVTTTKVLASGVVTMINVLIWFYVIQTLVTNINNWRLALLYAFGCSVGTVISTYYFHLREDNEKNLPNSQSDLKE